MPAPSPLTLGSQAPDFTYQDKAGNTLSTEKLKGSFRLIYFYPRDNTPGCTKEACAFRDLYSEFEEAGITVIGVSCDDLTSHAKFRKKYDLPFALASDDDGSVVRAYGVWGEKKFMGKVYDGIHRMSFLVNPEGKIAQVYPKVKPEAHAQQVLTDAQELI